VRVDHLPLIANSPFAKLVNWGDLHGLMGDTIVWMAGLHAAAAVYHQVMLRDGVLVSMLPWGRVR
jgi:cytochrome b561